jgi:hypothetical protein
MSRRDLIVAALLGPELLSKLSETEWDLLIRQGRRANLLARLAYLLIQNGHIDAVPCQPRLHLISALRMVERQDIAMRWEVNCIRKALANVGVQIVLLKGAAYVMAELPPAYGRTFSDIDILVPKHFLDKVESKLMLHGWQGTHHDAYDQRYYRRWMHEIPPMRHIRRGTTIDVHHAILPETARIKVNTPALLEAVLAVPNHSNLFVLNPEDMVLHSATHLFHEGGLENGLRDLFDLDSLLRYYGKHQEFWNALVPRAIKLGLTRPLYYAIRFTTTILDTPVPQAVVSAARVGKPPSVIARLMDFCYQRALRPAHASCSTPGTALARAALYIRSHWIRMPFHLLAYHLARKAIRQHKSLQPEAPFAAKER